jgi:hypothetical protein
MGKYAILTDPILEMFDTICQWIDSHAPGGYIYGFSRYGKTFASMFWIAQLLTERYSGRLPYFRLIYKEHDRFSEALFLSELLGACPHERDRAPTKKLMLDRIARHYATSATLHGGNRIVLLVDEAQNMHEPEYQTLCNLENEVEQLGFKLTVVSLGSHELTFQHKALLLMGKVHLTARYMLRSTRFRGIQNQDELESTLRAYDTLTEWPAGSGNTFTKHFFPKAFEDGYRIASLAGDMWSIFAELGPHKPGYHLEVPMEHIAKSIEFIFRNFTDERIGKNGLDKADLISAIMNTEYQGHMNAISYARSDQGKTDR